MGFWFVFGLIFNSHNKFPHFHASTPWCVWLEFQYINNKLLVCIKTIPSLVLSRRTRILRISFAQNILIYNSRLFIAKERCVLLTGAIITPVLLRAVVKKRRENGTIFLLFLKYINHTNNTNCNAVTFSWPVKNAFFFIFHCVRSVFTMHIYTQQWRRKKSRIINSQ